jgi:outer membrane lipoprotein-sorting protein
MTVMRRATIGLLVCGAVSLQAQRPATDPAAGAALARMEAAYRTLDALHVKVRWSARYTGAMSADDFPLPGPDTLELRMQRPNRLFLSAASKRLGRQSSFLVVSDGTTLSAWKSWTNTYRQVKAPETLAGMARLLPDDIIGVSFDGTWESQSIAEWELLGNDGGLPAAKAAAESGAVLTMTGPETLGGAQVYVVRIASPAGAMPFTFEQRLYLEAESYLLRGLAMSARGKNPDNGRDFTVEMQGQYDVHTTQPTFSDADFRFVPPRGARPGVSP